MKLESEKFSKLKYDLQDFIGQTLNLADVDEENKVLALRFDNDRSLIIGLNMMAIGYKKETKK